MLNCLTWMAHYIKCNQLCLHVSVDEISCQWKHLDACHFMHVAWDGRFGTGPYPPSESIGPRTRPNPSPSPRNNPSPGTIPSPSPGRSPETRPKPRTCLYVPISSTMHKNVKRTNPQNNHKNHNKQTSATPSNACAVLPLPNKPTCKA